MRVPKQMPGAFAVSRRLILASFACSRDSAIVFPMHHMTQLCLALRVHAQPVSVNFSEARASRISLAMLAAYCLKQSPSFRYQQLARTIQQPRQVNRNCVEYAR
ncbi:hypothetical protein [Paraburkholderia terrae]|uniref:hypothetical protein n=1 Tax=Paraburkholderia terrae TaxID=311230 RepID=UPI002052B871|nr:hypothetical protein [Paraburkholderia terrae]BDC45117.1 hypothetical protein PTKU15_84140 [Paraburkholderia terrae]